MSTLTAARKNILMASESPAARRIVRCLIGCAFAVLAARQESVSGGESRPCGNGCD